MATLYTDQTHRPANRPSLFDKMGTLWCRTMHNSIMWPMHGRYQCRTCLRYHVIPWEGKVNPQPETSPQTSPVPETQRA